MGMNALAVLAAYLIGAVPFTQIISRWLTGADLRAVGTGTVSGTGLYRVAGLRALILGGGLDVAKGALAAALAGGDDTSGVLVSAAVVTGHCWSVFLGGAGGRGLSPAMGTLAVLWWPGALLLLAGLAIGRLADATGLAALISDLLLVVLLGVTAGLRGVALAVAVVVPMLLKRLMGNARPEPAGGVRIYWTRLLYDADQHARTKERPTVKPARSRLDAAALEATVRLLADRFDRHRTELNRLNVYPIPDGDTGDNLVATLGSVTARLPSAGERADVVDAIATGALLGGRGSSGVIFGQALRGFVSSLPDPCGPQGLALALASAAAAAREAVADPVEGTILTVADDAARQAGATASTAQGLGEVARAAAAEGRRSLARTPDLLPVLADAGVVDAGGLGYVLFLDCLAEALTGVKSPALELVAPVLHTTGGGGDGEVRPRGGGRYEVLCLVATGKEQLASLRERWLSLGDTVAIAGGGHAWRAHVHTDDVVEALTAARLAGQVSEVEITDLVGQSAGEKGLRAGESGAVSVVAVAEGDALVAAYLEAGAHRVVLGGITAKPSTGELLRVVDACASPVVLLAGDKDVVPAAKRAVELATVPARLVSADMLTGLLALEAVGPLLDCDVAAGAARLEEVSQDIRTVRVQRAVRDAHTEFGEVRAGQWLAMGRAGPVALGATAAEALVGAAAALVTAGASWALVALDQEASTADDVIARLRQAHPDVQWLVRRTNRPSCAYGIAVR
jgi:acyl-phosphate glycerol 3-phosphate acyltransferase